MELKWKNFKKESPENYTDVIFMYKDTNPSGGDLFVIGYVDAGEKGGGTIRDSRTEEELLYVNGKYLDPYLWAEFVEYIE